MSQRPDLVILTGTLKGRRFAVGEGALRLGRSSSNDIPIPDEELSRNHCLFECSGENGIRVTDLASANGTVVNGVTLGNDPFELKIGDLVEVGHTQISVGELAEEPSARAVVDLGLSAEAASGGGGEALPAQPVKRSPVINLLWAIAVIVALGAMALIVFVPSETSAPKPIAVAVHEPTVREVVYEKVKADAQGIFRYALTATAGGQLTVKIDDTMNNRHMTPKSAPLSAEGLAEIDKILSYKALAQLDEDYTGIEPDPPALDSMTLKVVYSTRVKTVSVVNTQEPEAFAAIRGKLEAFSKSELGVWAIAYSRERLIELAEEAVRLGEAKWSDRDVNHGNLAAAIVAYQEAMFYLETVNPKPECMRTAVDGLARAKAELDRRYTDQRFLADRALNLSQWATARDELRILLEMVPDRKDDRNRDAQQKLISAENNLKKKGGK